MCPLCGGLRGMVCHSTLFDSYTVYLFIVKSSVNEAINIICISLMIKILLLMYFTFETNFKVLQ